MLQGTGLPHHTHVPCCINSITVGAPTDVGGAQAERGDLATGGPDNRGVLQSRLAAFLKACPASVIVLEGAQVRRDPLTHPALVLSCQQGTSRFGATGSGDGSLGRF